MLSSDFDEVELVRQSNEIGRAEIIVTLEDEPEFEKGSDVREIVNSGVMQTYEHANVDFLQNEFNEVEAFDGVVDRRTISIGTQFVDSVSFKQFLKSKAILENFGLKIKASEKRRVIAVCSYRGCPWRVRASLCSDGQTFEVRKYEPSHHCPDVNRGGNKQATSNWVAHEIQDMIKKQPDITPKVINDSLERTYGLSLPYMKLWRSRELARDIIFGAVEDNYKWVPTLRLELLKRNPGSHIVYTYDEQDYSFSRFFISFKVCIDGFIVGCRPLIGLDACHLKSKYLGVMLSATSLDGNNGLFLLAFAVVETESKSTWEWFLLNLLEAFTYEITPLAFISDMEKGLEHAVKYVFPYAEHRVCMRNLWKNIKKYHHTQDSQKLRNLVWSASNTYTKHIFEAKLIELLNCSPSVHSYLLNLPYKWSKCDFSEDIKNQYNTNNMAESLNSWVGGARGKPVVDLVDMIRSMLMEQRAERRMRSSKWRGELVSFAEDYIREITTKKEHLIVRQSTPTKAEVEGHHGRYEVNIENKLCSCMYWQMTGLPCINAVAFIGMKGHPLWHTYIDDHYHVYRYHMAYEGAIATMPGKEQWIVANDDIGIGAPQTMRLRGRPRKNRFKNFLESTNTHKKITKVHKCGRCGLHGHHRNTCKNPLKDLPSTIPESGQSSQSNSRSKLPVRRADDT